MNRGMLVSAVFKHTLELDLTTAKKSAAVTLMSTDVDSIGSAFVIMHDLWAGIIELAIGVYLLARYVGAAAFLISVPAVRECTYPLASAEQNLLLTSGQSLLYHLNTSLRRMVRPEKPGIRRYKNGLPQSTIP